MIKLTNVKKTYGKKTVLQVNDLTIELGKIYGIIGPNGSGKTTLLKTLLGLRQKDTGSILLNGDPLIGSPVNEISFMSDKNDLQDISILKNISFISTIHKDINREVLKEILTLIPIDLNSTPNEISKGQLALVRLAFCISRTTPIYVLDEPFDGLDVIVRRKVIEFLLKYVEFDKKTVIITSHQLEIIEPLIDEAIILHEGHIHDSFNLDDLRDKKGQSLVEYFESSFKHLYESEDK